MSDKTYTILYGLHSNIPACCVAFFLTDWQREAFDDSSPYAKAVRAAPEYEYVPCPECFAMRRVNRLRHCDRDCPQGYTHCRDSFKGDNLTESQGDTVRLFYQHMGDYLK